MPGRLPSVIACTKTGPGSLTLQVRLLILRRDPGTQAHFADHLRGRVGVNVGQDRARPDLLTGSGSSPSRNQRYTVAGTGPSDVAHSASCTP